MKENQIVLPPDAKEKGVRIIPPQDCEVEKIETVDGVLTVMFKARERKLPKSWEEFCETHQIKDREFYILEDSRIGYDEDNYRCDSTDRNVLPDRATAEAVLALCQLIQLRNCYNGDWVPNWTSPKAKFIIYFDSCGNLNSTSCVSSPALLFFKTEELCDQFLCCFSPLIEKLKPLYGIKEGGEE